MKNVRTRTILEDRLYVFALITLSLQRLHSSMPEDDLIKAVKEHFKEIKDEDIRQYKHELHLAHFIDYHEVKAKKEGEFDIHYWALTKRGRDFLSLIDPRYL